MWNFGAFLLFAFCLAGQEADTGVVFKTTTNLVVVDIFVRDRNGKPVENLKKEDFRLTENGKPQEIAICEFQRLSVEPLSAANATAGVNDNTPRSNGIRVESPGKVQYRDKRLLVMFFDFSSMQPQEQIRAQSAALKFLNEQMTASDLVAVMTLGAGVQVVQDFTNDRERLIQSIKSFRIGDSSDLSIEADTGDPGSGEYTGASIVADDTEFNVFNSDRKLVALETAVRMLSALPEKKALLYFSSGIPKTGVENHSQLLATTNAAVRSNVAIYPIDARGLVALVPGGDASKAAPKGASIFTGSALTTQKQKFNDQQETLFTLAEDTGGKALLDSNELSTGIRQAQEDLGSYYVLSYYASNTAADGKFRRIEVTIPKQYQAQLDYHQGFFAAKEFSRLTAGDRERQIQEALMLGDPATDLPIALEVNYFRLVQDKFFVPVAIKIPGSEIPTRRRGGADATEFDFAGQVFDQHGKLAGNVRDTIKVTLGEGGAAQLGNRALQYDTGFTLTPGAYRLKFLVRENQNGKMGTFETEFTIPNLNADPSGLRVSSVVWAGQREAIAAAVGAGENQKLLANHPLVFEGQKLIPSITRTLTRKQSLYVYFEVYDTAQEPSTKKPRVRAAVSFYRKGVKVFESDPLELDTLSTRRRGALPVQLQVSLAKLQPGRYTCQVNVIDAAARKFEFLRAPLVVLP